MILLLSDVSIVTPAVVPDYKQRERFDTVWSFSLASLSMVISLTNKGKRKTSLTDTRVTSPPDVCLSVGSLFSFDLE